MIFDLDRALVKTERLKTISYARAVVEGRKLQLVIVFYLVACST
jgi:hypothetical protein